MKTMYINIGKTSWLTSAYGDYIDTPIHVRCGKLIFPDESWTDTTFPILCEWAETVFRSYASNRERYSLFFHDGPFRLDVEPRDLKNVDIRCINFREQERCECEWTCLLKDLVVALYTALSDFSDFLLASRPICPNSMDIYKQSKYYETKLIDFLAKIEEDK